MIHPKITSHALGLSFLLLLFGCRESPKNIFLDLRPKLLTFEKSYTIVGQHVPVDNFGGTNVFVVDTLLLFPTPQLDTLYSIVSANTYKHLGNYVSKGNGPNEFINTLPPISIYKKSGDLYTSLHDPYKKELIGWNLTETISKQVPVFEDVTKFSSLDGTHAIYRIHPLDEEAFFLDYLDFDGLNQHYAVYHIPSEKIVDDRAALISGITERGNSYLLATSTSFSLANRKYVSGMGFIDQLNIYDLAHPEESKALTIHKKRIGMKEVERTPMPEKMEYYVDVRSDSERIYALYANQNRKDWAVNETPAVIQVFDWDGNPICELKTKEKIVYFDVDENRRKLYGLTIEEDLYVYDLGEIDFFR